MAGALTKDFSDFQWLGAGFLGVVAVASVGFLAFGKAVPSTLIFGAIAGAALVFFGQGKNQGKKSAGLRQFSAAELADVEFEDKQAKAAKKAARKKAKDDAAAAAALAKEKREAEKKAEKNRREKEKKAKKAAAKMKEASEEQAPPQKKNKKKKKKKKQQPVVEVKPESESDDAAEADEWAVYKSKSKARLEAKRAEEKISGKPDVTETMTIASKHFGAIIGNEGSNLDRLEKATKARINLPKKDSKSRVVTITGQPAAIASAKQALTDIVTNGYATLLNPNMTSRKMEVPGNKLGVLIGPSGSTVRTIQDRTGCKVQLPKKGDDNTEVTILGDASGVLMAVNAINSLVTDGFSDLTHEGWTKMTIAFPSSLIAMLLGPKGATVQAMQKRTSTRINIPNTRSDSGNEQITIVGESSNVHAATMEIRKLQAEFCKDECEFPEALIAALIGPKGSTIRGIQSRTGCRLDVSDHLWDPSLKTIELEGVKTAVADAKREIAIIIESNCRVEVEFPSDRIGSLIGTKGSTLSKIQKDIGQDKIRIKIEDHEWDTGVKDVRIDGPNALVKAAVDEIERLKENLIAQAKARKEKEEKDAAARLAAKQAREEAQAAAAAAAAAAATPAPVAPVAVAAN